MLHTKALYNLLRFNLQEDPSIPHEPWAVEDLRPVPLEELFGRLKQNGLSLDRETFLPFAESADTPEELAEVLLADAVDPQIHDPLYLILFELWRRLLPEKPALSIFCDELDHRIALYDRNQLESDEQIQDALANLQEILDENADTGADPREIFASMEEDCAHDIESFLYDYISDLLDAGNRLYASELIEGFFPYVPEPIWFDLLSARLLFFTDIAEANARIAQILEQKPELSLLFALLQCLSNAGDHSLFVTAAKQAIPLLETEGEFQEMLSLVAHHYRLLDLESLEQAIQTLMQKRKDPSTLLAPEDPDLKAFAQIIQ